MANALKCDRCKNYFDYSPVTKNFIAFGHKDIVIGKNFPVKDICPDCMEQFMTWFENPDNVDEEYQKALEGIKTYVEYKDPCKSCHNDDERVNNLYKEAEEISNNAGDTKEEEE